MAPASRPRSHRRRTTTTLGALAAVAAALAVAATAPTGASAARALAGTGGSGWIPGVGGGQLAKNVRREEQKLEKQFEQRISGGGTGAGGGTGGGTGGGGGGGGRWQQQQQRVGQLPAAKCLYIHDLDRTLTGIQGSGTGSRGDGSCPSDVTVSIVDKAYKGGSLTFSDLALNMASTYAGKNCYLGIISAGNATSDAERMAVAKLLSSDSGNAKMPAAKELKWTDLSASKTPAPFLYNAPDATAKYNHVHLIQSYFKANGVEIKDEDVFFIDDLAKNLVGWKNSGYKYNAQQISCLSRDKDLGKCGATVKEMATKKTGCNLCTGPC